MKKIILTTFMLLLAGCARENVIRLPTIPESWRGRCVDYFMRDFVTIDAHGNLWTGITIPGSWQKGIHSLKGAHIIPLDTLPMELTVTKRELGQLAAEIIADANLDCNHFFPILEVLSSNRTPVAFFRLGGKSQTGGVDFIPTLPTNLNNTVLIECFPEHVVLNGSNLSNNAMHSMFTNSFSSKMEGRTFVVIPDKTVTIQRLVNVLCECDSVTKLGNVHLITKKPEITKTGAQP